MDCIVFGTGTAFLGEVLGVMARAGWTAVGFVEGGEDDVAAPEGVELATSDDVPSEWLRLPVVIPLLTPWRRKALEATAREIGFDRFPALVDPSALVADGVTLGGGALVNAGVVIGTNTRLGHMTVVNRSASIGHDNTIGDYSFVGPGAILAGRISVGDGSVIGTGAVVKPGTVIGDACVVGLASAVHRDVEAGSMVLGNPARVVKTGMMERDVVV